MYLSGWVVSGILLAGSVDAAADPKLSALTAEFDYYFGPAKP